MSTRPQKAALAVALVMMNAILFVSNPVLADESGMIEAFLGAGAGVPQFDLDSVKVDELCPLIKGFNDMDNNMACNMLGKAQTGMLALVKTACPTPTVTGVGAQIEPPTKNADGTTAPKALNVIPGGVPRSVNGTLQAQLRREEGGTYAFLWRAVNNLYIYRTCSPANGGSLERYLVPAGWTAAPGTDGGVIVNKQQQNFTAEPTTAYAAAFTKGTKLVILFRGTATAGEWVTNFNYSLNAKVRIPDLDAATRAAEAAAAAPRVRRTRERASGTFPGKAHAGFAMIYKQMWPKLGPALALAAAKDSQIKTVIFAGHSQGAPVAALTAYAASKYLRRKRGAGEVAVNAVLFGSPLAGDAALASGLAQHVNLRNVRFGNDPVSFIACASDPAEHLGMPACGAASGVLVPTEPTVKGGTYISNYQPTWGEMTFTSADMPIQQAEWAATDTLTRGTAAARMVQSHICAYHCLAASLSSGYGGDHCVLAGTAAGHTPCLAPAALGARPDEAECDGAACGAGGASLPGAAPLRACTAAELADSITTIRAFTAARPDLTSEIRVSWDDSRFVASVGPTMERIYRAAMLPCDPQVSLGNLAAAPPNVQLIARVLPLEKWNELIRPEYVGMAGGNGPPPEGFKSPTQSYTTFLNLAGRFPYLCGEAGRYPSLQDACAHELAALFAHMGQETGNGIVPPPPLPVWKTLLAYTREQTCYGRQPPCAQYDSAVYDSKYGGTPGTHYFGRGGHQLSYSYNYGLFSAELFGDLTVLGRNPELVAFDAYGVLASAVWFYMTPQPSKPSIHDVMVGNYLPRADKWGVTRDADGRVADPFVASISVINGAVECGPTLQAPQSVNRIKYYVELLEYLGATKTPVEAAYVPGTTACAIVNKLPNNSTVWADPDLADQPLVYLQTHPAQVSTKCMAIGWQPGDREGVGFPLVSLIPVGQLAVCQKFNP